MINRGLCWLKKRDLSRWLSILVSLPYVTCCISPRDKSRFLGVLLGISFSLNNSFGCCFPVEDAEKNGIPVLFRTGIIVCCGPFFQVCAVSDYGFVNEFPVCCSLSFSAYII